MIRTLLTALTVSVMFSSPSFADWTKVSEDVNGNTFYVDSERIKKHGGYVYWWTLGDYLKRIIHGGLSSKVYNQGDCNLSRVKVLNYSFHKEPMGRGTGQVITPKNLKLDYPPPNSVDEIMLKRMCSR